LLVRSNCCIHITCHTILVIVEDRSSIMWQSVSDIPFNKCGVEENLQTYCRGVKTPKMSYGDKNGLLQNFKGTFYMEFTFDEWKMFGGVLQQCCRGLIKSWFSVNLWKCTLLVLLLWSSWDFTFSNHTLLTPWWICVTWSHKQNISIAQMCIYRLLCQMEGNVTVPAYLVFKCVYTCGRCRPASTRLRWGQCHRDKKNYVS